MRKGSMRRSQRNRFHREKTQAATAISRGVRAEEDVGAPSEPHDPANRGGGTQRPPRNTDPHGGAPEGGEAAPDLL